VRTEKRRNRVVMAEREGRQRACAGGNAVSERWKGVCRTFPASAGTCRSGQHLAVSVADGERRLAMKKERQEGGK